MATIRMLGTSWLLFACSDESNPLLVVAAGAGGATTVAGAGGAAAGASTGGTSSGGAGGTAGAGGAAGAGGVAAVPVVPFDPVVLFEFDATDAGVETYGWVAETTGSVELVGEDRDPSNATPGALRFVARFAPYNELGQSPVATAIFQFGDATTGTTRALTGGTRVHFWVRLVSPVASPDSFSFFQPFIQGGTISAFSNNFGYVTGDTAADNLWHEYVLEVAGQAFMSDVWRVGLSVTPEAPVAAAAPDAGAAISSDAGADAGGPAPETVTFDIDYIWVE